MARAPHRNTFDSKVASINDFKRYFSIMGSRFPKTPLGNISGGIANAGREIIGRPRSFGNFGGWTS